MPTVQGQVISRQGIPIGNAAITFFQKQTAEPGVARSSPGGHFTAEAVAGSNVVVTVAEGYNPEVSGVDVPAGGLTGLTIVPERAEAVTPLPLSPPVELPPDVEDLLELLDQPRFSLDAPVSLLEATQSVGLFAVVNLMLAGQGRVTIGGEERADMLGIRRLFYGLSDRSLTQRVVVVPDPDELWRKIEGGLQQLIQEIDRLELDVQFLGREAKRQFNLGTSNDVLANTEFPQHMERYIDLAAEPSLALNLQAEADNPLSDKLRLAEAYNLLRDLKSVILQMVRMLSKYGTAATRTVNETWADFDKRALEILATVAASRADPDSDELFAFTFLPHLIGRRREEIIPHVALAKHGTKLLQLAVEIYVEMLRTKSLDLFDRDNLRKLFQPEGIPESDFFTTRLRREADILKRYQVRLT